MKIFTLLLTTAAVFTATARAGEPTALFKDDFQWKLAEGWTWVREDPKAWRVTGQGLEIHIQPGNMWGPANNATNVLLHAVPEPGAEAIEVAVTVSNKPTSQYEQVDLVWYYDDGHMVKIGLEQVDNVLCLVMGREERDKTRTLAKIPIEAHTLDLRLLASGETLKGQYRPAGETGWKDAAECALPKNGEPKVSLQVYQGPKDAEHWARFSAFRIARAP